MTIRVYQRGQAGEMSRITAQYDAMSPFHTSNIQPNAGSGVADYGAYAAQHGQLLSGLGGWHASRPMAMPGQGPWVGNVQIQQGSPASRHIPSARTVMRDAYQQPHSRAPRLYGPSLGQALGSVYRW
jgi:hypothetical protein